MLGEREGKRNLRSQPCSVQLDWNLLSQYKNLTANGMIFFFRTNVLNICFSCPIPNMILFGFLRSSQVPPAYQVKKSWKWIMWGGITGRGFTGIHFLPQAKTLTTEYYINNLLEKEVKPLLYRENNMFTVMKQQTERKCSVQIATWRSSKTGRQHTQPRPPKHGAKKPLPNQCYRGNKLAPKFPWYQPCGES